MCLVLIYKPLIINQANVVPQKRDYNLGADEPPSSPQNGFTLQQQSLPYERTSSSSPFFSHTSINKSYVNTKQATSFGFIITVKTMDNVRGHFAAFVTFKTKNQCHIIILLFETLQFWFK